MFMMRTKKFAATLGLAVAGGGVACLGIAGTAAPAHAAPAGGGCEFGLSCTYTVGEKLWVAYGNSPLRKCAGDNCAVITYMPVTTSFNPGGGWVTSEANQSSAGAWCIINYRGTTGWTGCWRL
jgi:hypothetical protein